MRKILTFILIIFQITLSQSIKSWNSISVTTVDNLSSMTINPAGVGINNGSMVGISVFDYQTDSNDVKINYAFKSDEGDYYYSVALGFSNHKYRYYSGIQYFSQSILRSGYLYRPFNFLSLGYVFDRYFKDDIDLHVIGTGIRPFGNRITLGADVSLEHTDNDDEIKTTYFTEVNPLDGISLKFGYEPDDEIFKFSTSVDFANLQAVVGGRSKDKYHDHIGFQTFSKDRKTIFNPLRKRKDEQQYVEMSLCGVFIEEPTRKPGLFDSMFDVKIPFFGSSKYQYIQLRKWIDGVDEITSNQDVDGLIIYLKGVGGGFGKLSEARNALQRFKDSGKKIIVYAQYISNTNYYLISMAEIYINDVSEIDLRGLNFQITFYKDLLDTLGIHYEVEKTSNYKSALDKFSRSTMSKEMKENIGLMCSDIYNEFVEAIARGRNWEVESTKDIINNGPYSSKQAKEKKMVTKLLYFDEFVKYKKDLNKSKVKFASFNKYTDPNVYSYDWNPSKQKEKIAVIYAVGGIVPGKSRRIGVGPSSIMGSETIAKAISQARENKNIKAIILRIDSGGGSALASDIIWREVVKTTTGKDKKVFIASMSDVAASGGYYIACQADTIIANPGTITGSIGVISGKPCFQELLEKVGIKNERLLFGDNASIYSSTKFWTEKERKIIHDRMLSIYDTFLSRVTKGRKDMDSLEVDKVGKGRVWSGKTAKEHRLVDITGGIDKSLEIAKQMADIDKDKEIEVVEYPFIDKFSFLKTIYDDTKVKSIDIELSGSLKEIQEALESIPDFENDRMQMVLPYQIKIK